MAFVSEFDREYSRIIHEIVVPGKRLGRHIHIDPADIAANPVTPVLPSNAQIVTKLWDRHIPILNQGTIGMCTGAATIGMLGTDPFYDPTKELDLNEAVTFYEYETTIDGLGQPYPPNDRGSSGQAALETAVHFGYASSYYYALGLQETLLTLSNYGPVIAGINWYDSFDSPDANGLISLPATATIRGGHEIEALGINAENELIQFANSWSATWGSGGYFYMPFSVLETLLSQEGTIGTVSVAPPAPVPTPTQG